MKLTLVFASMAIAMTALAQNRVEGDAGYLYCHMSDRGEWTAYALSPDGVNFHDLKGGMPVFDPAEHARIEGGTRDAYITRAHDGNGYLMVTTDMCVAKSGKWDNYGIDLLRSDDLINWTSTTFDFRKGPEIFSNPDGADPYKDYSTISRVWAPQIFWDPNYLWPNGDKGGYFIYYSLVNRPEEAYDRMYYSYADRNFDNLTKPRLLFDWGYATIDADINYLPTDSLYHMMIKKEGGHPGIFTSTAPALTGPWCEPNDSDFVSFEGKKMCEGVSTFQLPNDSTWRVAYVEYSSNPHRYRICQADEYLRNFHSPTSIKGVDAPQHGSFMRINKDEYDRLQAWSDAQVQTLYSPDSTAVLRVSPNAQGIPTYSLSMVDANGGETMVIEQSPLGLMANHADLSRNLNLARVKTFAVDKSYDLSRSKKSHVDYKANGLKLTYNNPEGQAIHIEFQLGDNQLAFRYELPQRGQTAACVVEEEATGFRFPEGTTTFLTPQSDAMIGWMRTKPSYEEEYVLDTAIDAPSKYGHGFTFPALMRLGDNGWVLVSETGNDGTYPGTHLSEYSDSLGGFTIAFPMPEENNGFGDHRAQLSIPGKTPWRTLAFGRDLKPIVETTVQFDVVEPLYEPSVDYKPGASAWSWIVWQDNSINFEDQIAFADLAKEMGWRYILVDGLWDKQIGRERMPELFKEIRQRGVEPFLWYNSNGGWNDAPQGAKQCMADPITRRKEMKWLQENGVKGIKVDFFAGDKQETMRLYRDILADANDYGIQVIFHGCTLPRGWERMYPNYCSSEAVLASENVVFQQHFADEEAHNLTTHPFIRNAVGSMDFGGTFLQPVLNRKCANGTQRRTTDAFELASAVTVQSSVQNFALTPRDLKEQPQWQIDFMKTVPTAWDEIELIDGFPGEYVIMARRSGSQWYIAALNASKSPREIEISDLQKYFPAGSATLISDGKNLKTPTQTQIKATSKPLKVKLAPDGGAVIY